MEKQVNSILDEIKSFDASTQEELEQFRMKFISKKSVIAELFGEMKNIPNEEKKLFGMQINKLKEAAQARFKVLIADLEQAKENGADPNYEEQK